MLVATLCHLQLARCAQFLGSFFSVQPEPTNAQHAILRECILTNILEQLFETKPALHALLKHLVAGKRLLLGSIYGV